ncbi:DUF6655 family protein [Aureliella helgolandensis]|uniref:Uncharacterized protein n=1 Tax=Aureliella helgolandensis TaxID=2527968 RepID=A0A518GDL6_9BACT|nr:DUF6655 family protein [Aureliella helgolandensis]QDV26692.1 hypothetical protein Q31a_50690 [Aureliella helgolandensis]
MRSASCHFQRLKLCVRWCAIVCIGLGCSGCGATKSYTATEQLLLSDAVDAAVSKIDFQPLSGQKVYLDTTYVKTQKSALLVDSDYVISSLRQQMVSAGVYLVEGREEATLIAEARMGALGLDGHSVTYGLPASNTLSAASSVLGGSAAIPALPEMSLARNERTAGAAKIAVFAYERETREPYWQSGVARSSSNAKDTWVLGVGPFQRGTIYKRTRFAGDLMTGETAAQDAVDVRKSASFAEYMSSHTFEKPPEPGEITHPDSDAVVNASVQSASAEVADAPSDSTSAEPTKKP